jgi:hypothetical protein
MGRMLMTECVEALLEGRVVISSLVGTGDQEDKKWTDLCIHSHTSYLCFISRTSLLTQTY